jgi:hypothetical protein
MLHISTETEMIGYGSQNADEKAETNFQDDNSRIRFQLGFIKLSNGDSFISKQNVLLIHPGIIIPLSTEMVVDG